MPSLPEQFELSVEPSNDLSEQIATCLKSALKKKMALKGISGLSVAPEKPTQDDVLSLAAEHLKQALGLNEAAERDQNSETRMVDALMSFNVSLDEARAFTSTLPDDIAS